MTDEPAQSDFAPIRLKLLTFLIFVTKMEQEGGKQVGNNKARPILTGLTRFMAGAGSYLIGSCSIRPQLLQY